MQSALQVLSFSTEECETIYKILASILHLGNIYFHRKQLKHGYEGVEIGSEVEIKWAAHLLQLSVTGIKKARLCTHIRLLLVLITNIGKFKLSGFWPDVEVLVETKAKRKVLETFID